MDKVTTIGLDLAKTSFVAFGAARFWCFSGSSPLVWQATDESRNPGGDAPQHGLFCSGSGLRWNGRVGYRADAAEDASEERDEQPAVPGIDQAHRDHAFQSAMR